MTLRTDDRSYSQDYWDSLDDGRGYVDGTTWEDLACAIKETFGYSWPDKRNDVSLDMNVLDLGCAMGYLVGHMRRRGMLNAWGCDISKYALDNAPSDVQPYLRQYDLTGKHPPLMPHIDWKWDLLICLETLEHIEERQVPTALGNIREALSEDGMALLSICTDEVPDHASDPTHVCIRSWGWWDDMLTLNGLTSVEPNRLESLRNWRFFANHPGLFLVGRADSDTPKVSSKRVAGGTQ